MNLTFTPKAWEDYQYWAESDRKILKRIHELMRDIQRSPYEGIGKPEALWSYNELLLAFNLYCKTPFGLQF
ncbi:MAG: Txe/YoeB family addiction module toxin [Verrucomicrobiales bacterium]